MSTESKRKQCIKSKQYKTWNYQAFQEKEGLPETTIKELETNSKIKNTRDFYMGISDFKKGYQPRCNIVSDEKGDKVADSHSVLD